MSEARGDNCRQCADARDNRLVVENAKVASEVMGWPVKGVVDAYLDYYHQQGHPRSYLVQI